MKQNGQDVTKSKCVGGTLSFLLELVTVHLFWDMCHMVCTSILTSLVNQFSG